MIQCRSVGRSVQLRRARMTTFRVAVWWQAATASCRHAAFGHHAHPIGSARNTVLPPRPRPVGHTLFLSLLPCCRGHSASNVILFSVLLLPPPPRRSCKVETDKNIILAAVSLRVDDSDNRCRHCEPKVQCHWVPARHPTARPPPPPDVY
jgi:hypothetical protein